LIQNLGIDDKKQDEYFDLLFQTCAEYDDNIHKSSLKYLPVKCERTSYDFTDELLVLFFQDVLVPVLKSKYKIKLDGWIYYNTQQFHEEILLVTNKYLDFQNVTRMKNTTYDHIPTITQFRKSMDDKKLLYDKSINKNIILSNYVRISPLSI
jgi:formyltetrahydrofolate hydrolase